jgi:hypothetical protein
MTSQPSMGAIVAALQGTELDTGTVFRPKTWAGNIICTHFLKNQGADGKIFEEKLLILTSWTMFLQIWSNICCQF